VLPLLYRAYQVHSIENGIFSVSPNVIFSAYEITQYNGGYLKSQTDVIIRKCRSKVSLDGYAEKLNVCAMLKKVYMSKRYSSVVDVCACDGLLLDKGRGVKCAFRKKGKPLCVGSIFIS